MRRLSGWADAGTVERASIVTLARSGIALAVRKGATHPDIGSVEALKRALLAATPYPWRRTECALQ